MSDLNTSDTSLSYDPNRLLDALLAWMGIASDKKLSQSLGLSTQLIRGLRAGCLPVRASLLTLMAEAAGRTIDELRRVLGDRRSKARMSCPIRSHT